MGGLSGGSETFTIVTQAGQNFSTKEKQVVPVAPVYEKLMKDPSRDRPQKGKKSHLAGIEPTIMKTSSGRSCHSAILSDAMAVGVVVGGLVADLETFRDHGCAIYI